MKNILTSPFLILILVIGLTVLFASCQRADSQGGENSMFKDVLISTTWPGLNIELPGYNGPVKDKLGVDLNLTFKENGKAILKKGDQDLNLKWKIKDDTLYLTGSGIKAEASLEANWSSKELENFYLMDIDNYPVWFYSQAYLDTLDDKLKEIKEKDAKDLAEWMDNSDVDLSTASLEFAERLKTYKFEKFTPVSLANDKEKEEFIKEYFKPLLTLGLEKTSWDYFYRDGGDKLLDAYELYVFNQELDPSERKARAGQEEFVPYEDIEKYIGSRLATYSDPYKYELQDMLMASERYSQQYHSLKMQIKEEGPAVFDAELLEAWYHEQFGGVRVLHMFYPETKQHAWFLVEYNSASDTPYYKAASVSD